MKELVSKCCEAKVELLTLPISVYGSIEKEYYCLKCHEPCEVIAEKPKVTKKDIFDFHHNLTSITFKKHKGWKKIDDEERRYIEAWLKSKGVEVEK